VRLGGGGYGTRDSEVMGIGRWSEVEGIGGRGRGDE
jgi:hypothetical protein